MLQRAIGAFKGSDKCVPTHTRARTTDGTHERGGQSKQNTTATTPRRARRARPLDHTDTTNTNKKRRGITTPPGGWLTGSELVAEVIVLCEKRVLVGPPQRRLENEGDHHFVRRVLCSQHAVEGW